MIHHHHPGRLHPLPTAALSLLRVSVCLPAARRGGFVGGIVGDRVSGTAP
jgi:hypothetical protein